MEYKGEREYKEEVKKNNMDPLTDVCSQMGNILTRLTQQPPQQQQPQLLLTEEIITNFLAQAQKLVEIIPEHDEGTRKTLNDTITRIADLYQAKKSKNL